MNVTKQSKASSKYRRQSMGVASGSRDHVERERLPDDPISVFDGILRPIAGLTLLAALLRYMPADGPSLGTLLVWAVACSMVSGALWAALVHLSQKRRIPVLRKSTGLFGGNGKEPNGPESLLWTIIVFCPLILAAIHLTSHQRANHPTSAFLGYLVGTAAGALAFYGYRVRKRFLRRNYSYFKRETWLVFWWAVLLAIPGFVGYQIGLIVHGGPDALNMQLLLTQIIFVVVLLWSMVTAFVVLIPGDEHANVRGIWAGSFLGLASLSALLIEPSDLLSWLRYVIPSL